MWMDCSSGSLLQGLDMMINKIFAPALRAQEVRHSGGLGCQFIARCGIFNFILPKGSEHKNKHKG